MQKWIGIGIASILLLGGAFALCASTHQPQPLSSPAGQVLPMESQAVQSHMPPQTAKADFEVENKTVHRTHFTAAYPQIKGLPGKLTEENINQDLENIIRKYSEHMTANDKLSMDYQVTSISGHFYSFVFEGTFTQGLKDGIGGESFPILETLSYDAQTGFRVTNENLIKQDKHSLEAFGKLYSAYAGKDAAAFGNYMGVFFTETDVVFYYLGDDAAQGYTQVKVPLDKAKPFFNDPIQPLD